jgi:serine/threonine protein kinase/tetratricopeptide (TPR) repeat protein
VTLTAGTRIGSYEIVGPLGAGGMGEIYRARDVRLDRTVAIKALPQAFAHDPERRARFEREARLLASLSHPNIAGIYGVEDFERVPFLVLEYVPGETLGVRLSREPLPVSEAVRTVRQIASAIEAAHERGIVHRDLKPGNVMLTADGTVKVLDFGIAKGDAAASAPSGAADATARATMTGEGVILGTAAYMSPEQARGRPVDRRTDIWALGCILYECLAGRRPFSGATATDTLAKVIEREPDWSAIPSAVPAMLREWVRRCLTKDAERRPSDVGELRRDLDRLGAPAAEGSSGSAAASPSLAVLYFENLSSDKESEYFCAGITEDILTDLSKIKGLRVASRNAVARFRGTVVDIPRVAADLGVTAVMEGSVRRSGERVRITAQLINASDGFHLWAERYDRTLQDVFAVQEEIASSIATALRGALTPSESRELHRDRPSDAKAYDLYLKGRELYSRYALESLREALETFRKAIEVDPDYALAWAGIADCYGQLHQWGSDPKGIDLGQGLLAARRAIALDPRLPEAHKAEALVLRSQGNMAASHASLLRAIAIHPRFTPALSNLGVGAFQEANLAGTERYFREIRRIDPHEAFAAQWLLQLLVITRRYDEAYELGAEVLRIAPNPFYQVSAHSQLAVVHLARNEHEAARNEARMIAAGDPMSGNAWIFEAIIALRGGDLDEADRLVARAMDSPQLGLGSILGAAAVEVSRGRKDNALKFLARPLLIGTGPVLVRLHPQLWSLLDDPPFAPRRSSMTLIWPQEAPAPPEGVEELFAGVRLESGIPQ